MVIKSPVILSAMLAVLVSQACVVNARLGQEHGQDADERKLGSYYNQHYPSYYPPSYYPPYYPPWYPTYPQPPTPAPPTTYCLWPKQYQECGTACPATCGDPDPAGPCTLNCVQGCFCPQGLVLNQATDQCVPLAYCPTVPGPSCGAGEEYDDLTGACVAVSCDAPSACATGLTCVPATINCIRAPCPQFTCQPTQPTTCTGGKAYTECTSYCAPTCQNQSPGPCILSCGPPGCECPSGTVLDTSTDTCVPSWQCPYTPPSNAYTVEQCEAIGGTVVGDPGDGRTMRPGYVCESTGLPPLGPLVGSGFIEGGVCCGAGGGGGGGGSYYPPWWWYGGGGGGGYYGPGYYPGYYHGGYYGGGYYGHGGGSYGSYGHGYPHHKQ